jgi:hypothetical protein
MGKPDDKTASNVTPGYVLGRPSVVKDGRVLAPGRVARYFIAVVSPKIFEGTEKGLAYFDSGLYRPGTSGPTYAVLAYAICLVKAGVRQPPNWKWSQLEGGDNLLKQGELNITNLTSEQHARLADSPAARGPQLYDMVAAQMALLCLKNQGFRGAVQGISDGRSVIEFMSGLEPSLSLRVEGIDIAPDLRKALLETGSAFSELTWRWVPRAENLAGPVLKEHLETWIRGFRRGRKVGDIPVNRLWEEVDPR